MVKRLLRGVALVYWPHLDKSPPRNYLCLYCQSWAEISTADARVLSKQSFRSIERQKNDHHNQRNGSLWSRFPNFEPGQAASPNVGAIYLAIY